MSTEANTLSRSAVQTNAPRLAHLSTGTLLLVEDSRAASDLIRLLFRGSGGRLRRVDTLAAARQHLALYTPDIALIDLGLPDGSGLDLIRAMSCARPRVPLIVAMSGLPDVAQTALAAGADHFFAKPFEDMHAVQRLMAQVFFPLRNAPVDTGNLHPDHAARRDDLVLAHDLLCGTQSDGTRDYALHFTQSLARVLQDDALAAAVADARRYGRVGTLAALLAHYLRASPMV
ncbi:MAG: response regulator [Roseinatronobacter sp.]